MQDPLEPTPWGGDYIPPPPPPSYSGSSDIPPSSPYHRSPLPRPSNRNKAGWKIIGFPGVIAVHYQNVEKFRDKKYTADPLSIADMS